MKVDPFGKTTTASYTAGNTSIDVVLDSSFTETAIVVNGLSVGTVTVLAKIIGSDDFESVTDGQIDLTSNKSIVIPNVQIESVRLSVSPDASFDAAISQY